MATWKMDWVEWMDCMNECNKMRTGFGDCHLNALTGIGSVNKSFENRSEGSEKVYCRCRSWSCRCYQTYPWREKRSWRILNLVWFPLQGLSRNAIFVACALSFGPRGFQSACAFRGRPHSQRQESQLWIEPTDCLHQPSCRTRLDQLCFTLFRFWCTRWLVFFFFCFYIKCSNALLTNLKWSKMSERFKHLSSTWETSGSSSGSCRCRP